MPYPQGPLFAVLGPLAVAAADGTVQPMPPGRRRSLLAALLRSRNRWVDNDTLAAALWDKADLPSSISGSIKTYVHQLRKVLPPGVGAPRLAGRGGAYRLTVDDGELDADVFESLVGAGVDALGRDDPGEAARLQQRALALWRGTPEDDALDPVTARHLDELRWTARYSLADALIAAGEPTEAIALVRAMLSEDQLREPAWERLVNAQRAAGWQVDALASYEQARVLLLDTFGAEPGSRLQSAYRALLSETVDRPVRPHRPVVAPVPASGATVPGAAVRGAAVRGAAVPAAAPDPRRRRTAGALLALVLAGVLVLVAGSTAASQRGPAGGMAGGVPTAPRILFGLGPDPMQAKKSPLLETGIGMITTWYHNKPENLTQFEGWREDVIPEIYASGRALHVVVATWDDTVSLETRFGRACGQPSPLSPEFLVDMRRLAAAFAGPANGPPLYVSMFNGLEKLTCAGGGYLEDRATTNYYMALKEQYLEIMRVMHAAAPNVQVALNWDGWAASHDDPEKGAGLSMFQYFVESMEASDFQSFAAFVTEGNAEHIAQMVRVLGERGQVMVSHYNPHEDPLDIYLDDLHRTFTPEALAELVAHGLFAFSFKNADMQKEYPELMTLTSGIVQEYGRFPASR